MTYRDPGDFGKESAPWWRSLFGMVRRVRVRFTEGTLWQFSGIPKETIKSEIFTGIGVYARPAGDANAEAILVQIGGPKSFAVVALRDEPTRQLIAGDVQPGETMIYTDKACVYIKDDGTIEIRTKDGTAKRIATTDDVDQIAEWLEARPLGGSGATVPGPGVVPRAAGTAVLRAE